MRAQIIAARSAHAGQTPPLTGLETAAIQRTHWQRRAAGNDGDLQPCLSVAASQQSDVCCAARLRL